MLRCKRNFVSCARRSSASAWSIAWPGSGRPAHRRPAMPRGSGRRGCPRPGRPTRPPGGRRRRPPRPRRLQGRPPRAQRLRDSGRPPSSRDALRRPAVRRSARAAAGDRVGIKSGGLCGGSGGGTACPGFGMGMNPAGRDRILGGARHRYPGGMRPKTLISLL